jgi:hypothetical protein
MACSMSAASTLTWSCAQSGRQMGWHACSGSGQAAHVSKTRRHGQGEGARRAKAGSADGRGSGHRGQVTNLLLAGNNDLAVGSLLCGLGLFLVSAARMSGKCAIKTYFDIWIHKTLRASRYASHCTTITSSMWHVHLNVTP